MLNRRWPHGLSTWNCLNSVLNVKAVVAAFNLEKALVEAFSVITNLRMELFGALAQVTTTTTWNFPTWPWAVFAGAVWAELRTLLLSRYSVSRLKEVLYTLYSLPPDPHSHSVYVQTLWPSYSMANPRIWGIVYKGANQNTQTIVKHNWTR